MIDAPFELRVVPESTCLRRQLLGQFDIELYQQLQA